MWDRPRFSELRPLTKIYVGVFIVAVWVALIFLAGSLGLRTLGRLVFTLFGIAATCVIGIAPPIERFFLGLAARKRQSENSDS